jgi:hypothetical protein
MAIIEHWTRQIGFARWLLDALVADISDSEAAERPGPDLPPLAWHVGHVAVTNAGCYLGMGKNDWSSIPEEWITFFRQGTQLPDDASVLPALSSIVPRMHRWDDEITAYVGSLRDEDLGTELQCRERGLVPDEVRTLQDAVTFLPLHALYHTGEVGLQRRRLGKPRIT